MILMKRFIYLAYVCGIIVLVVCAICKVIPASNVSLFLIGTGVVVTFLFIGGYPLEHIHYETKETLQERERKKANPMLWKLLVIWAIPLAIGLTISYLLELYM